MRQKLLPLAVASAVVSAPVMAQSNVQVYGVMDLGYSYMSGSDNGLIPVDFKSRSAIDSGNQAESRLGFRGTEDLGNGLKAFFTIESGLSPDRASRTTSDRHAFVGLEGGFGRVSLGRHMNPVREMLSDLDPFGAAGVGSMENIYRTTVWIDNSIRYMSPDLSGFRVGGSYSNRVEMNFLGFDLPTVITDIPGDEIAIPKGVDNINTRFMSLVGSYSRGPLTAGLTYEHLKNDYVGYKEKRWNLLGSYDFGVVKVSAAFGTVKSEFFDALDVDGKQWMLAATVPVSEAGTVLFSYNRSKRDIDVGSFDLGSLKGSQWAVGYNHALSKRTNVYATYAHAKGNAIAETLGLHDVGPGPNGWLAGNYRKGVNIGIRHNF